MIRHRIFGCIGLLLLAGIVGCIPSKPVSESPPVLPIGTSPGDTPATTAPPVIPKATGDEKDTKLVVSAGNLPGANANVQVVPMENGKGFYLRGTLGLSGTIMRSGEGTEEWVLSAEFVSPDPPCRVGEPFCSTMDNLVVGQESVKMRQNTKMMLITIPVKLLTAEQAKQEPTKIPVSLKIKAQKDVQFSVVLSSML